MLLGLHRGPKLVDPNGGWEGSFVSVTESLTRWMPGIGVVRSYRREWLRSDVTAGLVLAAILVPAGFTAAIGAGQAATLDVVGARDEGLATEVARSIAQP